MSSPPPRYVLFYVAAGLVLAAALGLRLFGHEWDSGWYLQPDERFIAIVLTDRIHAPRLNDLGALLDPSHSPLNPRSVDDTGQPRAFAYGSLPLYVTDVTAWAVGVATRTDRNTYAAIGSIGRYLTAVLDTLTVLLAMVYARRAYGQLAALLAGTLLACSAMVIQLAHFLTTDAWVTLFAMATLVASLRLAETRRRRWAFVAGVTIGAALATKVSVVTLALPALVAVALPPPGRQRRFPGRSEFGLMVALGAGALLTFAVFEPYAILSPGPFITDAQTQWQIVTGRFDVPYTRQFVGTVPGVYQLSNLVHWGLGPALGLAAIIAVALALRRQFKRVSAPDAILLVWVLPYFIEIATAEAKFLRYVEPIVPALVVLVAASLARFVETQRPRSLRRALAAAVVALVVVQTGLWAVAFESIYTVPHTRVAASEWIYAHIPAGSTITAEYWDDALPLPLGGRDPNAYRVLTMDLYADRPNQQALDYIAGGLQQADYIILSSNRLASSIPRLPWRYPVTAEYYRLLESGQLGFRLVYDGTDFPRLGPFQFDDQSADESFRVYDHPQVRIFKKVTTLSTQELDSRFASALVQPWSPTRAAPSGSLDLNQPVDTLPAATDLGWSSAVTQHPLVAVVVWLLALAVLGLAGLPIAAVLLRRFPDLGWGFSRLIGLLAVAYVVWIAVSLGLARFTVETVGLVIALVLAASWWGFRGQIRGSLETLRQQRRPILAAEAVFLCAFLGFLLLRSFNPDLWQTFFGGEKPMEMAFTSAIARSATFPPYDPWYAGGVMNYYYYGFYMVALLWKLTGIPPEIAFQLAIATVGGLLAAGTFSLTAALATRLLRIRQDRWRIAAGLLGVLLTMGVGNLDAAIQVLQHRSLTVDFWQSRSVVDGAITEFPYFSLIWADLHPHVIALPLTVLLLALAYAGIADPAGRPGAGGRTWLWLATAATVLGSLAVTNSWDLPLGAVVVGAALLYRPLGARPFSARAVALGGLQAGAVGAGAWVLFAPFFSHFVALVSGVRPTEWGTAIGQYLVNFGLPVGILALAAAVLVHGQWPERRSDPLRAGYGVLAALGGFVAATVAFGGTFTGAGQLLLSAAVAGLAGAALPWLAPLTARSEAAANRGVIAGVATSLAVGALGTARPTAAVLLAMVVAAWFLWLRLRDDAAAGFASLCVLAAAGVTLVADLIYVVDDLSGSIWERMNTVFKFYLEGWTLYALAATVALAWLLRRAYREREAAPLGLIATPMRRPTGAGVRKSSGRLPLASVAVGISVVLVLAGLAYPALATGPRLAETMPGTPAAPSLDGLAWMRHSTITNALGQTIDFSGDYNAIRWLRQNAVGLPVILEASIGPYRGNGSRISAATGFPDVLGWDRHERQQRYEPGIDQRLHDVRLLYDTPNVELKLQVLHEYRVRYIVVGDVERLWTVPDGFAGLSTPGGYYATPEGLAAFDQMVGTSLTVAFRSGHTTVYELPPIPSLSPSLPAGVTP